MKSMWIGGMLMSFALALGAMSELPAAEAYQVSPDAVADLEATLADARAHARLALVVLGANWCHDSRALAERMNRQPLKGLIDAHYETRLIDVGYLEIDDALLDRLGIPAYYATPTVLILDPHDGTLVNADDRHQWAGAADIGPEAAADYFSRMAGGGARQADPGGNTELARLLGDIDAWERRMAGRVRAGYAHLGPLLEAYKGGRPVPESFDAEWEELAEFRLALPQRAATLRTDARRRVDRGEAGIRLAFPPDPVFSWEEPSPGRR